MRGVYEAVVAISGVTAAKTLVYITSPSSKVVEIFSAQVTNASNETNEQMECCLQTVSSLGTPTKTDLTPSKMEAGDQAAGSTVCGNVTASEPTYSSNTQIGREGQPSLGGWRFQPTPEERPVIAPSATMGLRLLSSSLSSVDLVATIRFREIG